MVFSSSVIGAGVEEAAFVAVGDFGAGFAVADRAGECCPVVDWAVRIDDSATMAANRKIGSLRTCSG